MQRIDEIITATVILINIQYSLLFHIEYLY